MADVYGGIVKGLQEVIEYQKGERDLRKSDWVEVVRCKDCKRYRHDDVFHRWYCSIGMTKRATSKDDYCSWGERREDET